MLGNAPIVSSIPFGCHPFGLDLIHFSTPQVKLTGMHIVVGFNDNIVPDLVEDRFGVPIAESGVVPADLAVVAPGIEFFIARNTLLKVEIFRMWIPQIRQEALCFREQSRPAGMRDLREWSQPGTSADHGRIVVGRKHVDICAVAAAHGIVKADRLRVPFRHARINAMSVRPPTVLR